jgi:glycosyltransferase involved in cell wall biosynthesis
MARYILVGADPKMASSHTGGVVTLSAGLIDYVRGHGHDMEVVNTLRPSFELSLWRRLRSGIVRIRQLTAALRRESCDGVIIISGAGFSFVERVALAAVCRVRGVRNLLVIVDGWFLETPKASYPKRALVRWLLKIPDKVTSTGKRWTEFFRDFGVQDERIVPIHYWLPESTVVESRPRSGPRASRLHFVFVGWMIAEKGINELLSAVEELCRDHAFSLTLIGGGRLLDDVRARISASGWGESVSALGWVSDEKLDEVLACADVFVLPSYAEGFPMSLIEAFSRGIPAICTDVGGVSDSLRDGENGFLISPRQVRPLADAMARYIRNPQIISEHSRAALDAVRSNHNAQYNCDLILAALR